MLTRRGLFKVVGALGLGTLLPSKIFCESFAPARIPPRRGTQGPSTTCEPFPQGRPGETTSPLDNETRMDLLDSVDCMEQLSGMARSKSAEDILVDLY